MERRCDSADRCPLERCAPRPSAATGFRSLVPRSVTAEGAQDLSSAYRLSTVKQNPEAITEPQLRAQYHSAGWLSSSL